ncbi:MAG: hypothetical protein K0R34_1546 [Herbinix sp.]|jgi:uncharacterized protein YbbK (DUF523 family)|nr:hypothetical protein [Herbinix sp.]
MYLVSACLAGVNCRYDGKGSVNEKVLELVNQGLAIPVCPEQLGGLTTPRISCELVGDKKVVNKEGTDRTEEFMLGAERTLLIAKALGVNKAIMKSKSPSCGCGQIYDGTFSGTLIPGNGVAVSLLLKNGIEVITEKDL